MIDTISPWLFVPLAIFLWTLLIVLILRDAAPDPDPESLTGLDVLERTGHHPG
jgi:hypothetical protein